MLDTESQWSEALAGNNIRAIIRWLAKLTDEGDADMEEILQAFSCWVQRTSEFAKKEILTLCFSRCQGLWMFLDRSSFTRVHMLLQRLRNLLTLAQWARRQLCSAHLWHGVGVPCMICRDTCGSSDIRRGCWNREHRALKQHIWLGRLVQWWGITGLLSKFPEAQEVKRIAQMWKEMEHSHQKACLEKPGREKTGRFSSLIQGMVTELDRQHGCIWTSEDGTDQCYPPPNLQALLKLVLVPRIDNMSVQAIVSIPTTHSEKQSLLLYVHSIQVVYFLTYVSQLMYFILDVANFLQCKDDLLQSFCHAFTIPPSYSQQIRAFWMFDHGHVKASMELLLSPRAAVPWLSWQHRCIIHCLLTRKQPQVALQYLQWTRPAVETAEDAKLCADVLLQSSCVSDAWDVLKRGHSESEDMVMHFLQACNGLSLCSEALKYIPARSKVGDSLATQLHILYTPKMHVRNTLPVKNLYQGEEDDSGVNTTRLQMKKKDRPTCPLSAKLYQAQRVKRVSSEELLTLVRKAVMEVRKPHPKISEVVWPEHTERKSNGKEIFLSTQALCHLTPSPSPMDRAEETERTSHIDDPEAEQPVIYNHQERVSSFEDLSSVSASSFTSASSLPLMKQDRPYVYERTLTLQRISSLLTDGENQSSEDEEEGEEGEEAESRTPSSNDALPDSRELLLTPDGATDPTSISSLNKDNSVELMLSPEGGEADEKSLEEDISTVDEPSMDENHPSEFTRLNLQSDSQSVPDFLSPDYEKGASCSCEGVSEGIIRGPPDVTSVLVNREEQSDWLPSQVFSCSEAATSDGFLEKKINQTAAEHHQQEEPLRCFNEDVSCTPSDTTHDLLTDLHQSFVLKEPKPCDSPETSEQDGSLLTTVCSSTFLTHLQGVSLTSIPTCSIKTTSAPSNDSAPKFRIEMDELCVSGASAWPDHCSTGNWWQQSTETCTDSRGILSAAEPGAGISSDNKRPSLVLTQPYNYSLLNFMDFTTKQKGDNSDGKQAEKEEAAGWSSSVRASQGAIRSGRTRSRKGKRVKRT